MLFLAIDQVCFSGSAHAVTHSKVLMHSWYLPERVPLRGLSHWVVDWLQLYNYAGLTSRFEV